MKLLRRYTTLLWMIVFTICGRIFPSVICQRLRIKKKLLELACGTGIQSVRFSQAGFDVTGLDLSADMLKIAEKRAASAKQKIAFLKATCWIYRKLVSMTL